MRSLSIPVLLLGVSLVGCTTDRDLEPEGTFRVAVTAVDGGMVPDATAPLPPNLGDRLERWSLTVEALDAQGNPDTSYAGVARLEVVPGSLDSVSGPSALGRNLRFSGGKAEGEARVTAMFGPTRLWVTDIGYVPAGPDETPACSNGVDDDGDVAVDFPNDPGCAFADDMTEEEGTLRTGVSEAIAYDLPSLADVQGRGALTPYDAVAVDVKTQPSRLIVTRVASDGFYVSDIDETNGYGHVFAFNFNPPEGMRVCHRLERLSGTASEFFGFTELSFPSYDIGRVTEVDGASCARDADCAETEFCERRSVTAVGRCQPCLVPDPVVLTASLIQNDSGMEQLESALVRVEQPRIPAKLGPGVPLEEQSTFLFETNATNCDLNGDGQVDFLDERESRCSNQCGSADDCSEWTGYAARGNYKVLVGQVVIQINTGTAQGFDPLKHRGKTLAYVTGTLRNFSGGSLNWTIETRCAEDLVCTFDDVCVPEPLPSHSACIAPATEGDNDAASN
ncbi:MAG: hypothetical protein R3B72_17785 [Polyangiaceae bacterium]